MCVAQIDNQDGEKPKNSLGKIYLLEAIFQLLFRIFLP